MSGPSALSWGTDRRFPSPSSAGRWLFGRGGAAVALTLASMAVLVWNARLPSFADVVGSVDPRLVGLAFFVSCLTLVVKAARWRVLFPPRQRPNLGLAIAGIAVGQVVNWAFPTRLGEVVRVGLVNPYGRTPGSLRIGDGVAVGVGVLIVEKVIDVGMLLLTLGLLIAVAGLPDWFRPYGLLAPAAIGVLAIGACLVARRPGSGVSSALMGTIVWRLLPRRVRELDDPLGAMALGLSAWWSRGTALQALLWSVVAWAAGGLVNAVILRGFDAQLAAPALLGATLSVLVALYGGAVLPALPGRLGIFQSLCVLALLPFGLSFDRALAVSVVLYGVVYVPPLLLGLLALILARPMRTRAA